MKLALIVSFLATSLALNAQTLQGKVVRVADGDTITIYRTEGNPRHDLVESHRRTPTRPWSHINLESKKEKMR